MCNYLRMNCFPWYEETEMLHRHNEYVTQCMFVMPFVPFSISKKIDMKMKMEMDMEMYMHFLAQQYKRVKWLDMVAFERDDHSETNPTAKAATTKKHCILLEFKNKPLNYLAISGPSRKCPICHFDIARACHSHF